MPRRLIETTIKKRLSLGIISSKLGIKQIKIIHVVLMLIISTTCVHHIVKITKLHIKSLQGATQDNLRQKSGKFGRCSSTYEFMLWIRRWDDDNQNEWVLMTDSLILSDLWDFGFENSGFWQVYIKNQGHSI